MTLKPDPSKHLIIYADDDHDDLILIKDEFEKYSDKIEVITMFDGVETLHFLQNLSPADPVPCLIILDVNMPRMNGKETLKRIRSLKQFASTPIVLFTTSSFYHDQEFAGLYNAHFLSKPLRSIQIAGIADQFVEYCNDEIKESFRTTV